MFTGIQPSVWIGCLACYNSGRLVGDWYDADTADLVTPEDLHGRPTSHEELWVMDHDGFHGALEGECSPSDAAELAEILGEVASYETAPFSVWLNRNSECVEPEQWIERFREQFRGEFASEADYARDWFEDTAEPEQRELLRKNVWPFDSIDWQGAAFDLFVNSALDTEPAPMGHIYVFDYAE
ncbi:antirestriction protein ArdA [Streptomyces sp. CC210A]|uniref:antirestriction protein ArdA n=1 Tax=Streptomyces sp. CC210A TaxID=2898184 RepID=UPI001F1E087C|nr:antirestriction protein ArdA [Streptomyces sp. CC210A]